MDNNVTLPGDIPGLLRRGSPVIGDNGMRGTVLRAGPTVDVAWHVPDPYDSDWVLEDDYGEEGLRLDLTDPTGRHHAFLWLRENLSGTPDGGNINPFNDLHVHEGDDGWCVAVWVDGVCYTFDARDIPALDYDADGNDEVAGIIRLVCLHVAGRLVCLHVAGRGA